MRGEFSAGDAADASPARKRWVRSQKNKRRRCGRFFSHQTMNANFLSCPICQKRKPGRFCPAKAETICPVCCGTEREVTLDCPPDGGYLAAAHPYEEQHPRQLPADTPLLDVRLAPHPSRSHPPLLPPLPFPTANI